MIRRTTDLGRDDRAAFDMIIDVRSPGEFAKDHIPGAVNLPVLDDAERAEVGTLYVQKSKFLARRLGAAKVARNIASHLDGALSDQGGSFKPLIYCWRGGQRSGSMATVMGQVGWPVTLVDGGYQTWRRQVVARLYEPALETRGLAIILLDGRTGSGKTAVLSELASKGVQTLDLEGLAEHRGSLFGATSVKQPSQKQFESRLAVALEGLDPARPIVVEAESSRIGVLSVPPALWTAMQKGARITLKAQVAARTRHILENYADIAANKAALDRALTRLPSHHSRAVIARWREMANSGDVAALVEELMLDHYDPAYDRGADLSSGALLGEIEVDLSVAGIDTAARQVAELIARS